jgi:hypothetical protein
MTVTGATCSPMTLGNMRANGVHTLGVWYSGRGCGRHRVIDVERYGDDVPVPWFGPRMRCGHLIAGSDAAEQDQQRDQRSGSEDSFLRGEAFAFAGQ